MPRAALLLLLLPLLACEPATPRAKVQKPFPGEVTAAPATPAADGPPTREDLVRGVPGSIGSMEARHRGVRERLGEVQRSLQALEGEMAAETSPEQRQGLQARAVELRAAARVLAAEASALRDEAERLREAARRIDALANVPPTPTPPSPAVP